MTGVVIKSTGSWYSVKAENDQLINCRIKGKFRISGIKSTNPVTVGDIVDIEIEESNDNGVIYNIHDRKNCTRRLATRARQT